MNKKIKLRNESRICLKAIEKKHKQRGNNV